MHKKKLFFSLLALNATLLVSCEGIQKPISWKYSESISTNPQTSQNITSITQTSINNSSSSSNNSLFSSSTNNSSSSSNNQISSLEVPPTEECDHMLVIEGESQGRDLKIIGNTAYCDISLCTCKNCGKTYYVYTTHEIQENHVLVAFYNYEGNMDGCIEIPKNEVYENYGPIPQLDDAFIDATYYKFTGWDYDFSLPFQDHTFIRPTYTKEKFDDFITVWCDREDTDFMNLAIEKFNVVNKDKNYKIILEYVSGSDVTDKIIYDIYNSADVFHFPGDQLVKLNSAGALYPIPSTYTNELGFEKNVLTAGQIDEKQFAIPYTANTYFLYYDSSVYTEEDVKSLDTMLAKDLEEYNYNLAYDLDNGWYTQSFFFSAGATMQNKDDATYGFEGDEAIKKASDAYYSLVKNKKVVNDSGYGKFGIKGKHYGGYAAFVSGTWDKGVAENALGKEGYDCAVLPSIKMGNEEVQWKSVYNYNMIGVNATSKHTQLATKFATFISSPEIQALRYQTRGTIPTNKKAIDDYPDVFAYAKEAKAQMAVMSTEGQTFVQPSIAYSKNDFWENADEFYYSISEASDEDNALEVTKHFNNRLKGLYY